MNRAVGAIAVAVPVLLGISGTFDGSIPTGTPKRRLAKACDFSLRSCPESGCTKVNSADALTNILKRHFPEGSRAKPITFDDLIDLQTLAERRIGTAKKSLTLAQRKKLQKLRVGGRELNEGDLVSITGFIAGDPKPGAQETVNCNLRTTENKDIHINIAEEPGAEETDGFVAEVIPQKRPAGLNDADLSRIARDSVQVMFVGQLFYDSKHRVNDDLDNLLSGEPRRFTLFEIHPVTRVLRCRTRSGCDPKKSAEWAVVGEVDLP